MIPTAIYAGLAVWGGVWFYSQMTRVGTERHAPTPQRMASTLALSVGGCGLVAGWLA